MHRMYKLPRDSNLWQGDIIGSHKLRPALVGHQDYLAERADFEAFCIMTQTCDLVRPRESEFITLGVVRKITNIFDKSEARKTSTADRLKNIIQHRANTRFFYLYPEPQAGVLDDSVVDLRVMFALHKKHYQQIVDARNMSMDDIYAVNLGWMTGNVFSRIAMPEWQDVGAIPPLEQKIKSLQEAIDQRGQRPDELETPLATDRKMPNTTSDLPAT